jgi:hypothetical protein
MDPQKIVVDMLLARPVRQVPVSYSASLGIESEGSRVERLGSSLMGEESLPCRVRTWITHLSYERTRKLPSEL